MIGGAAMKLPRRKFLHLAAGAAALPAVTQERKPIRLDRCGWWWVFLLAAEPT